MIEKKREIIEFDPDSSRAWYDKPVGWVAKLRLLLTGILHLRPCRRLFARTRAAPIPRTFAADTPIGIDEDCNSTHFNFFFHMFFVR